MAQLAGNLLDRLSRTLATNQGDETVLAEAAMRYLLEKRNESESVQLDEITSLIVCCYADAAKLDLSPDQLRTQLQAVGLTEKQCEAMHGVYQKHKSELRTLLLRIGWHPPHVIGADWKLNYCVKGNVQGTIGQPSYLISLKLQDCDSTIPRDFAFSCSFEQLQDLVWKLKEATRTVQKTANQS